VPSKRVRPESRPYRKGIVHPDPRAVAKEERFLFQERVKAVIRGMEAEAARNPVPAPTQQNPLPPRVPSRDEAKAAVIACIPPQQKGRDARQIRRNAKQYLQNHNFLVSDSIVQTGYDDAAEDGFLFKRNRSKIKG
jgi:hypothetical protein